MRVRWFAAVTTIAGALAHAAPGSCWGDDGHRVIGEIAAHYLNPTAERRIHQFLKDAQYATLAEAATWADTYARGVARYEWARPLHYVNVKPSAPTYVPERDCPQGCVVSALSRFRSELSAPGEDEAARQRRLEALYFLAHFVGDLHQPLHVAHPDDRGGNSTQVSFFGESRRAHWVWDHGLFQRRPLTPSERARGATQTDWKELAFALRVRIEPAQVSAWQRSLSPERWATETLLLSRQEAFLRKDERVDARYVRTKWPVVERQLQKAGVRLAGLLNAALGEGDAATPSPTPPARRSNLEPSAPTRP